MERPRAPRRREVLDDYCLLTSADSWVFYGQQSGLSRKYRQPNFLMR
ncbi:hypothetical protein ACP4OV_023349 [Aristida adscensionis]